jgi:hypothetical protein
MSDDIIHRGPINIESKSGVIRYWCHHCKSDLSYEQAQEIDGSIREERGFSCFEFTWEARQPRVGNCQRAGSIDSYGRREPDTVTIPRAYYEALMAAAKVLPSMLFDYADDDVRREAYTAIEALRAASIKSEEKR